MKNFRMFRGMAIGLGVMMALYATAPAFAGTGTAGNSATKGGGVDPRQAASSETATVVMGKILTVNQADKFPMIQDVHYELERLSAWANDNPSAGESGQNIAKGSMPMPNQATSSEAVASHQTVTVSGDKASVQVGNFRDSAATNKVSGLTESRKVKGRTTPVSITFSRAGYYVYKAREVGSTPVSKDQSVPGVEYDNHEYFLVFYVNNKVDSQGNTIPGVYVSNITSYRNESGKETYKPNLTDIAVTTDNGNVAAKENTRENLAKVGLSSGETPNRLEAYRFWNDQFTHDVVLTNNVMGALGDRTKAFEFAVTLTGLEAGQTYTTSVPTEEGTPVSSTVSLVSTTKGTLTGGGTAIVANGQGEATFLVRLKDDDKLVLNALPVTACYTVNEAISDHVPSYTVTSAEENAVIAKGGEAKNVKSALSTAKETVDKPDGTVHIDYVNKRDLQTLTGLRGAFCPLAVTGVVLLVLLLVVAAGRRSSRIEIL